MAITTSKWNEDLSATSGEVKAWANSDMDPSPAYDLQSGVISLSEEDDIDDFSPTQKGIPITPPRVFDVALSRTLDGKTSSSLRERAMELRRPLLPSFIFEKNVLPDAYTVEGWPSGGNDSPTRGYYIQRDDGLVNADPSHTQAVVAKLAIRWDRAGPAAKKCAKVILILFASLALFAKLHSLTKGNNALSPCSVPYFDGTSFCAAGALQQGNEKSGKVHRQADFPAIKHIQERTFAILQKSADGLADFAPLITDTRLATNDVAILVSSVSDLKGKEHLATLLNEFTGSAKMIAREMNRFRSQSYTAFDSVALVLRHALLTVEEAEGSYAIYLPAIIRPGFYNNALTASFEEVSATMAMHLKRLIGTAEALGDKLESLRLKLDTILQAVSLERKDIATDRARVLASLWTLLGGNRDTLAEFDRNLELLLTIEDMRSDALRLIDRAIEAMARASDELEELTIRVASPALVGSAIPMHIQLESIRECVESLEETRNFEIVPARL